MQSVDIKKLGQLKVKPRQPILHQICQPFAFCRQRGAMLADTFKTTLPRRFVMPFSAIDTDTPFGGA